MQSSRTYSNSSGSSADDVLFLRPARRELQQLTGIIQDVFPLAPQRGSVWRMTFSSLTEDEKLAFAGLVRLMARMDGVLSPAEVKEIGKLAKEVSAAGIWSLMNAAGELSRADLVKLVDAVSPRHRGWITAGLTRIAHADGVHEAETELLVWLQSRWPRT